VSLAPHFDLLKRSKLHYKGVIKAGKKKRKEKNVRVKREKPPKKSKGKII
jgi:hypothetical protein